MHSASDQDPTPDMRPAKREIGLWDVARFLAGVVAAGVFLYGAVRLIVLGEDHASVAMTQGEAAELAVAIVMCVCGLVVSWHAFGAQKSAERRNERHNELAVLFVQHADITTTLEATAKRLDTLTTEVHDLLATEKGQQAHSAKARADVAKIQEDLTDLRVGVAEMAQRMPAEAPLLATLKAYIDAMFTEFRKQVDEVAEGSEAAGFLRYAQDRLNGSRPHLHTVDRER